jgi:hypothetical protein
LTGNLQFSQKFNLVFVQGAAALDTAAAKGLPYPLFSNRYLFRV